MPFTYIHVPKGHVLDTIIHVSTSDGLLIRGEDESFLVVAYKTVIPEMRKSMSRIGFEHGGCGYVDIHRSCEWWNVITEMMRTAQYPDFGQTAEITYAEGESSDQGDFVRIGIDNAHSFVYSADVFTEQIRNLYECIKRFCTENPVQAKKAY